MNGVLTRRNTMPMYKLDDFYKDLTILVHDSGFVQAGVGP